MTDESFEALFEKMELDRLDRILAATGRIEKALKTGGIQMATFREEMRAANQANADAAAALKVEADKIDAELQALAASGVSIPPQLQAGVDAIQASVDAMSPHVDAIQSNTEDLRAQLDEPAPPNP